jgi:hypothetical protein
MKLKTLIFECPPLPGIAAYRQALGVVNGAPGVYEPYYDPDFGLESAVYPIFLADGRIQLKINPKNYIRVTEFIGSDPGYKDYWGGVHREVRYGRLGFEITVIDIRAPLKLLFERIAEVQASTALQDGNWQSIKCWDGVRFEAEAFENGSYVTERSGAIISVEGNDGDGVYGPTTRFMCGNKPQIPETVLYSQPFTLKFLEAEPRLLR